MRALSAMMCLTMLVGGTASAVAAACPSNPDGIGTSRVITVDPSEHARIGTMQYHETLPLADKEVVLTFDDGPLPPYTNRVLETLAAECVKATFFIVGRQARAYPDMVRRVYNEGHTVASHSQNHPLIFTRLPMHSAEQEIEQGIATITAALGNERALAPFFRFPGLGRSNGIEAYLAANGIMTWSADFPADDWRHISAKQVMARALDRLERKGKGVLLLHDIQPATVLALPPLLKELKARGYRIVHVAPAGPDRPKTVTAPESWVMHRPAPAAWPRTLEPARPPELPAPSPEGFGFPELAEVTVLVPSSPVHQRGGLPRTRPQASFAWSRIAISRVPSLGALPMPGPSMDSLGALTAPEGLSSPRTAMVWPGARKPAAARARAAAHRRATAHKPPPRPAAVLPPPKPPTKLVSRIPSSSP